MKQDKMCKFSRKASESFSSYVQQYNRKQLNQLILCPFDARRLAGGKGLVCFGSFFRTLAVNPVSDFLDFRFSLLNSAIWWTKPDLRWLIPLSSKKTHAEKSAAPVAARVASLFKVAPHTAPLWPSNVPIQSPVSPWRIIGFPSEGIGWGHDLP